MNPGVVFKGIVAGVGLRLGDIGVEAAYFDGFLARNGRVLKATLLEAWPGLPLPKRDEYRRCSGCGDVAHRSQVGPHIAIMGIPCSGQYRPLAPLGKEPMADHTFAGVISQRVARWGLCEVCGEIHRVSRRDFQLIQHTRPLNKEIDGRKRKDPDCEGTRTIPAVISRRHPQEAEAEAEIARIYAAAPLHNPVHPLDRR